MEPARERRRLLDVLPGGETLHREKHCGWSDSWKPLTPYHKNQQLWECPSKDGCGSRAGQWRSYGWNRGGENRKDSARKKPANLVMFADTSRRISWLVIHNGCCGSNPALQAGGGEPHFIGTVHNEGANIAFWDGHVKWASQASIQPGDTHPSIFFDANRQ